MRTAVSGLRGLPVFGTAISSRNSQLPSESPATTPSTRSPCRSSAHNAIVPTLSALALRPASVAARVSAFVSLAAQPTSSTRCGPAPGFTTRSVSSLLPAKSPRRSASDSAPFVARSSGAKDFGSFASAGSSTASNGVAPRAASPLVAVNWMDIRPSP